MWLQYLLIGDRSRGRARARAPAGAPEALNHRTKHCSSHRGRWRTARGGRRRRRRRGRRRRVMRRRRLVPAERAPASASVSVRARGGGATRSSGGARTSRSSKNSWWYAGSASDPRPGSTRGVPPSRGSVLHRVDSARAICVESAHSASTHGGMELSEAFDKVWRAHHSMALAKRCASHLPIPC